MANTADIVARLSLQAGQFTSEIGRRFAEMDERARRTAGSVQNSFLNSFAEVQKLAQTALVAPRNAGGSLDLSGQIASLRAAKTEAEQLAIAQTELTAAFDRAAAEGGKGAAQLRLRADSAMAAAKAADANVVALDREIIALEQVQGELNKTTSATNQHAAATARAAVSAGQQRLGFQQLGFQLNDIAQGFSSGIPPMQIFAQQSSQVVQSIQLLTNRTTGFLGFMAGPWGAVLTAATVVLVPFVAKMLDGGDAAKQFAEELDKVKAGSSGVADAQSALGQVFDLVTGKVSNANAAFSAQNQLLLLNIRLTQLKLQAEGAAESANATKVLAQAGTRSIGGLLSDPGSLFGGFGRGIAGLTPEGRAANQAAIDLRIRSAQREFIAGYLKSGQITADQALQQIGKISDSGLKLSNSDFIQGVIDQVSGPLKKKVAEAIGRSLADGSLDPSLRNPPTTKRGGGSRAPGGGASADAEDANKRVEDQIARIAEQWDTVPRLIDKSKDATRQLDAIEERYLGKTDEVSKGILASVAHTRELIEVGKRRPFDDYVKSQRESLALDQLILAGRDADAELLQRILQLKQAQGKVDGPQIEQARALVAAHERIRDLLEDQQRIVNISTGSVHALQQSFDQFLTDLDTRPGKALNTLIGGAVNSFKQLQRDLLSNAIFGGIDRDIAKYVREVTGQQTPKEIIDEQATGAGTALKDFADTVESITFRLGGGLDALNGVSKGGGIPPSSVIQAILNANAANDNDNDADIVVTGRRKLDQNTLKMVDATQVWTRVSEKLTANLANLGVTIPQDIAKALPGALQGASIFSSIGSGFGGNGGNIGGGVGALLGSVAPNLVKSLGPFAAIYQIGQSIAQPIGKLLGFDKTNVGVGGLVGGLLGKIFGIGPSIKYGGAGLSIGANGVLSGTAGFGRGGSAIGGSTDSASGIAGQLNSILDQLGATVSTLAPITVGMWNGNYRVARANTTEALNGNSSVAKAGLVENFGSDQAAAIAYAVQYELSHAIISGISAASQRLLANGDAQAQLAKVMLVEAIPKDLKAMLDPVGAAIDNLNRGWAKTVAALDEGGATAEQYAQAQQLYKMQLDQVKASTASASATLKDFRDSLNFGSASPYSFRDQEASARAALQPFLDKINAGGNIDQSKYQDAAKAFLDIERQLYGSTQAYFDALDSIQAATSKAISTIDNAVPITPGVPDPFTKATADAAAKTAQGVQTGNEIADTQTDLLTRMTAALEQLAANGGTLDNGFIGDTRLFGGKLAGNG